ncbi:MAG: chemotaxis response regulator protein-glutamate methylesterase [Coxiella sp. (in: Bacteria)]|nr:MAG: chemotaxis response regulator protein-glutamate methylesterase [Coxiella sp. (in: g-proteobacteria)]
MIRILIVDDSRTIAMLLTAIFEKEPDMEVVGVAPNGKVAIEMTLELKPDIITMDIRMPIMNGFEATQEIMDVQPTPILVVSASVNDNELKIAFNAIESGALAVIEKPPGLEGDDYIKMHSSLMNHIRALSSVAVKRILPKYKDTQSIHLRNADGSLTNIRRGQAQNDLVALGTSVGGPVVLGQILSSLPSDFPIPIVIVQHIASGFIDGLVSWLNTSCRLIVKIAEEGEVLQAGVVYLGPKDTHFRLKRNGKDIFVSLSDTPTDSLFMPSINELFTSIAKICPGHAIAGLLTGMGDDGADALLELHKQNCHTFIQDEETCVVFGMPGVAKQLGAHDMELAEDQISNYILENLNHIKDSRARKRK